jgi:hypothetical protein
MDEEYSSDGVNWLNANDIKGTKTWPTKYEKKTQFIEVELKTGATRLVFGVLGDNKNLTFPLSRQQILDTLHDAHGKNELAALKLGNRDDKGSPLYPLWVLWRYYETNRNEIIEELAMKNQPRTCEELDKFLSFRPDQDIIHPEAKDLNTIGLLKQATVPSPIVMVHPEEKKKREKPTAAPESKKQKIEEEPVAKEKTKKPRREEGKKSELESSFITDKAPSLVKFILIRLQQWKVFEPAFMKNEATEKENMRSLEEKHGKEISLRPNLSFLLADGLPLKEHLSTFILFLISIEAQHYPVSVERVNAMKTDRAKEFLKPVVFEPKPMVMLPQFPIQIKMEFQANVENETELADATEKIKKLGGKISRAAAANLKVWQAHAAEQQNLEKVFVNEKGLNYDELAALVVANPAEFFWAIEKYWLACNITNPMVLLKSGARPYDTLNLLCLRYLNACKFGENAGAVEEDDDDSFGSFVGK